ncbi:amidohydrolase [Candidatus Fermentibacterales bacterium]|nr:amidohydrolase [Candidatus Fermentibacterales bacterium]
MAEPSNQEEATASFLEAFLRDTHPDSLVTGLGGYGLAAVYDSGRAGVSTLLRCELDALPMPETLAGPEGPVTRGCSHRCGHDGHMAMMCGAALDLSTSRPPSGRVTLLFQPAEETGEGAARVLAEAFFRDSCFDYAIALHNLPGFTMGSVILGEGRFAAASEGLIARLSGDSSHAAEPEKGRSPGKVFPYIISALSEVPQHSAGLQDSAKVTVIHARLGEVAFGTSPGKAVIMATLRAFDEKVMNALRTECESVCRRLSSAFGIDCEISRTQSFPATANDPAAVEVVRRAALSLGLGIHEVRRPFPWSEDFGHFTSVFRGALVGLGSGLEQPPLHHPEYVFPDELLETGRTLITSIAGALADAGESGEDLS